MDNLHNLTSFLVMLEMKDKMELFPITNLRTERKEITLSMNVLDWHRYDISKSLNKIFSSFFSLYFQTGEMEVRNPMFEDDATPKATK